MVPAIKIQPTLRHRSHSANQKDVQPVHASNHWASLQLPGLASALAFASQFPSLRWLRPLAATTLALTVWPIAQRAFKSISQDRRLNIDCLDLLALKPQRLAGQAGDSGPGGDSS